MWGNLCRKVQTIDEGALIGVSSTDANHCRGYLHEPVLEQLNNRMSDDVRYETGK